MNTDSMFPGWEFTPNAMQVLEQSRQKALEAARNLGFPEESFGHFWQGQIDSRLRLREKGRGEPQDRRIDAEEMFEILKECGTAEEMAAGYRDLARGSKISPPLYRQLRLSSQDRVLGGVCGGIAEYFQIDSVLVRVAFIACCLVAGMTLWLYPILWLVLLETDRRAGIVHRYPPLPRLILSFLKLFVSVLLLLKAILWPLISLLRPRKSGEPAPEASHPGTPGTPAMPGANGTAAPEATPAAVSHAAAVPSTSGRWLGKIFGIFAFLVMSLFFYLPATAVLLGGAAFCSWGIFYPIVEVDGFRFAFAALDTPGIVLAVFAALLLVCLFLLVFTFAGRLHFQARVLGKNAMVVTLVLVVISFFGVSSSVAMAILQNQAEMSVCQQNKMPVESLGDALEIGPEHLQALQGCGIKLNSLRILAEKGRTEVLVRCSLKARGATPESARAHLERIETSWPQGELLPRVRKHGDMFHFEEMSVEISVPAEKALSIRGSLKSPLVLEGEFAEPVVLDCQDGSVRMEQVVASSLNAKLERCALDAKGGRIGRFEFESHMGALKIRGVEFEEFQAKGESSHLSLEGASGKFRFVNRQGRIKLEECRGALDIDDEKGSVKIADHRFGEKSESFFRSAGGRSKFLFHESHVPRIEMVESKECEVQNHLGGAANADADLSFRVEGGALTLAPMGFREKERDRK